MEEIEELRAKVIASMAATGNPNSKIHKKPRKTREEGELSSSDDEEVRSSSAAQSTGTTTPPVEPRVASVTEHTQSSNMGKHFAVNGPASSGDMQLKTSVKQSYSKHFEKNPVPSKPGNHYTSGWYVPSVANNNLVISFSDDDSGSDSEEHEQERSLERKENALGVDGFKRPSSSSQIESYLRRTANNQMNKMPKKVPLSHRYISSTTKIHGAISRGSEPLLSEKVSPIQNSDPLTKTYTGNEHGFNQAMSLNNSKLENLRQQIAIRENQLKIHQSQKTNSGQFNNYNGNNLNNSATKKTRPASVKSVQLAPNEPDRKRLKLDEPSKSKLNYSQQQVLVPATKPISKLKGILSENIVCKDKNLAFRSHYTEEIPIGTTDLSTKKQQGNTEKKTLVSLGNLLPGVKGGESSLSFLESIFPTAPNSKLPNKQGVCRISCADTSTSSCWTEKGTSLAYPSTVLTQTSLLEQMTSRAGDEAACQPKMPSPKNLNTDGSKLCVIFGEPHSSSSSLNKATHHHNIEKSNECNEIIPGDKMHEPSADDLFEKCSVPVPENKSGISDCNASPINTSLLNCSDSLNLLGHRSIDLKTLMKMEEMLDKELEEAQGARRRCEMEEQNALKAYRTAQRALFEANARCTSLYRRRELFSAQYRHFITEDSSSLWSSGWHKHTKTGLDSLNILLEANVDPLPSSSHQMHAELDVFNRLGHDSNTQHTNDAIPNTYYRNTNECNLISKPCSEPDAGTSELLLLKDNNAMNRVSTPSNHTNMSADEDEPFDRNTVQSRLLSESEENFEKRQMGIKENPERKSLTDNAQDYALLEASLRSKLFARLGRKTESREGNLRFSGVYTVDSLNGDKESHLTMGNQPSVETDQKQMSDGEGTVGLGKNICDLPIQVGNQCVGDRYSSDCGSHGVADREESSSSLTEACRSASPVFSLASSVFRIVFSHVKLTFSVNFKGLQPRPQEKCTCDALHEDCGLGCYKFLHGFLRSHLTEDSLRGIDMREMGSYTCDLSIDPFWPVCMFELRGKCNDGECLWQHVKDYSRRNTKHRDPSTSADYEVGPMSHLEKCDGARKFSQCFRRHIMLSPPTYLVGLDILKADLHASGSNLSQSIGRYWQRGFNTSLADPFSFERNLLSDVPFFHRSDGRNEGQGGWNRRSLCFQIQDGAMKQLRHGLADPEQSLDLAIALSHGDANKLEREKKALSILSRALEANPTSVVLWIVYLHIYYRNEQAIGKDDMFSHAIHNNEGSYELWLMFINSRVQLDDRLVAYDTALSALCRNSSAPDRDKVHASACILDLLLQMIECLCMSGGIGEAIQKIFGLFPTATDVADHSSMLLSDILTCLTVSDKCIFWVCCVYFVIYRKLPDAVVQQFEFEKEFPFSIEWLPVQLTEDEKRRVVELMEMGVDSVALGINGGLHERETTSRMAHLLAVSHVRCVAVLDGVECCKNLLDKYIKLYPTSLELILTSARLRRNCFGDLGFEGFEDALRNWPGEIPGIQCIWNQYAQCALENGEIDFTKQLMVRWFQSVWKVNCPQSGTLVFRGDDGLYGLSELPSPKPGDCVVSNPKDQTFGLLNLSLHELLQNDQVGARLAIDRALKVAAPEDFKHCVREHAMFVLSNMSESIEGDTSACGIMSLLSSYLVDPRSSSVSVPLSRRFCQQVRKPRIQQLLNNILGSISRDYSLINSVLEIWFGSSLLPDNFGELKDLVDFVEALMEMFPANYWLALSVCRLITREFNSSSIAYASAVYWASSLLVNSIYQAFPVLPEHTLVEMASILSNTIECQGISERFHHRALSMCPFSINLWKSYYNLSKMTENTDVVIEAARKRGIKLD